MIEKSAATPATAAQVAESLGLAPHPEGGYFRETYRSPLTVDTARGRRALSTAVTFLVTAASPSRFHRLVSDEVWVYQAGEPLRLLLLHPEGALQQARLDDPQRAAACVGEPPTVATSCVPAGVWQAARVTPARPNDGDAERSWTLVTCFVSPGFDFDDFELGERRGLLAAHPRHRDSIIELT